MRAPEYEAALQDAKLYPELWRLALGILFIGFMILSVGAALIGGLAAVFAMSDDGMATIRFSAALRNVQAGASGNTAIDVPLAVLIVLLTFVGAFIGPLLAAAAFHFRGPGSLFGEFGDWIKGFLTALAVLVPVYLLLVGLSFAFDPPEPKLALATWLRYLPLALPLIFIQTAAEELIFRGYLQQQLAARFAARWVWMGLPALIFAALHWSPGAGANLALILLATFVFALAAADLSEQTGSLGAAMGMHFGNNVFGILVVAMGGTITGLSLYVSPEPVSATGMQSIGIGISIVIMLVVWRITRYLLTR